jgi:hypothetical protein
MKITKVTVQKSKTIPCKNGVYKKTGYILEAELDEKDDPETTKKYLTWKIDVWLDEA